MSGAEHEILAVVGKWVVARDSGLWDDLRATWHDDGRMNATWFAGGADEFVAASRAAFARGVQVQHFLGGSLVTVAGSRAIAQTKMTIIQRATVHDVECDITCRGRFYDFFEDRGGGWRIVLRQPIYELDRIDPVRPGARLILDPDRLAGYPPGCRHLLYAQEHLGMTVSTDVPGLRGITVDRLYASGESWLAGGPLDH